MSAAERRRIADVLASLDKTQQAMCDAGDPNAYFVALYRATTAKCLWLETAILDAGHPGHAGHRHLDARLIHDIVTHFEPRYSFAVSRRAAGDLDPRNPWRGVLRHAVEGSPTSILLLGAHTHIGFDLPAVLAGDLANGAPLFDAADPRQSHTLSALNRLFIAELPAIADNVHAAESVFARRGLPNVGGTARWLYSRRIRTIAAPALRLLLGAARAEAHRNADRLRRGKIDEARLGAMIDRRNRRFLAAWRAAGRTRRCRETDGYARTLAP